MVGLIMVAGLLGWVVRDLAEPVCPTEDSCTVDYHDHRWHITEVHP